MDLVKGIICPILTPMNEDESINEMELRNQVRRMLSAGIHGIFAFGTNGEGYALGDGEKEQVLSFILDEVKGRVPVYAGTGAVTTRDTIRLSLLAKSLGADVVSIVTPYFAQVSQEELYDHYAEISRTVDMPIVLYNIPARTGNVLAPATVERLSIIDNIVGAKDSSGNFDNMLQYIEGTRSQSFAILSGNDSLILWNLLAGGTGGIAGCANVFPETMVNIYNCFTRGELKDARKHQDSIRRFRDCFRFGNPNTIVKTAVAMSGYPVGKCRSPFTRVSDEGINALSNVLNEAKANGMR